MARSDTSVEIACLRVPGARRKELRGRQWDELDLDAGLVTRPTVSGSCRPQGPVRERPKMAPSAGARSHSYPPLSDLRSHKTRLVDREPLGCWVWSATRPRGLAITVRTDHLLSPEAVLAIDDAGVEARFTAAAVASTSTDPAGPRRPPRTSPDPPRRSEPGVLHGLGRQLL